jgi:hypothetical protein
MWFKALIGISKGVQRLNCDELVWIDDEVQETTAQSIHAFVDRFLMAFLNQ